jgi:hypothetical protein
MELLTLSHLKAIHEKVLDAWLTCPADVSPLDMDALYAFVSVILMQQLQEQLHTRNNTHTSPATMNTDRLLQIFMDPRIPTFQIVSCFFDSDKLYYDRTGMAKAMTSAGYTQAEKNVLWPLILKCIKQTQTQSQA